MADQKNIIGSVVGGLIALGAVWYFVGGGVQTSVANDAVSQYKLAKQHGSMIDACVHAGIVAESYLQAHDQENYVRWKQIQSSDCGAAGVPL